MAKKKIEVALDFFKVLVDSVQNDQKPMKMRSIRRIADQFTNNIKESRLMEST